MNTSVQATHPNNDNPGDIGLERDGQTPFAILTPAIRTAKKLKLVNANDVLLHSQLRLWMNSSSNDCSWASLARLAEEMGVSEATVKRSLSKLERLGFVHREKRLGTTDRTRALDEPGSWKVKWGTMPEAVEKSGLGWVAKVRDPGQNELGVGQNELGGSSKRPTISNTISNIDNEPLSKAEAIDEPSSNSEPKKWDTPGAREACEALAAAIEATKGQKLKITDKWLQDMDLLLRRGPTELAEPEEIPVSQVLGGIHWLFYGGGGRFVVMSPAALRKKWVRMRANKRQQDSRFGSSLSPAAPVDAGEPVDVDLESMWNQVSASSAERRPTPKELQASELGTSTAQPLEAVATKLSEVRDALAKPTT